MTKYVLAYHGGTMPATEAEQVATMEAWGAWFGTLGAAVVDPGNPTGASSTIASDGAVSAGGGANPISGYTVLQADDLDGAITLAKGCPLLAVGGSIEVAEIIEM